MHKELYLGAAYYPEMWDESEVDKDVERCKALGINVMRVGEFAWGSMEPKEGEFNFGWLKRAVDKLYENGIYTIMCTPTCTPPRWLLDKYEETRMLLHTGVRADVSSRCHPCKSSEIMREKNRIIVTEMAKAFKDCRGIIGWQIDNEMFPYWDGCYCDKCVANFRKYLQNKYGDIQNLNRKWGMQRWSLEYESYDAVKPPHPEQWKHPSLCTEWWNFQCEQIFSYIDEQADVLHSFGYKNVGTDMMMNNVFSYYKANRKLDVVQHNHYDPAANLPRTGFWYDFLRPIKPAPFWVTETQVGWSGGNYAENGYRPQGNCYINSFLPIALGAEMNAYWLFRSHPNGHELAHGSLYTSCGRPYKVSDEVRRLSDDLAKCKPMLTGSKIKSDVALHFSSAAAINFMYAPMVKNFRYADTLMDKFYLALGHYNVDIIDVPHSLDGYKTLISPFTTTFDDDFKARVTKWVENGGTWIVGPMSDIMTDYTSKYTDSPFSFLEELAGVYVKYQKPVDNDVFKAEWEDGGKVGVSTYFDAIEPKTAKSLAKYVNEEYEGYSVITQRKVGKGKVILLGSVVNKKSLLKLLGVKPIADASDNVRLVERDNGVILALETCNEEGYVELDGKYTDVLTGKHCEGKTKVAPYTALVLKKS